MAAEPKPGFRLEVVEDDNEHSAPPDRRDEHAAQALMLALTALSQRALVALSSLFSLITVGLTFWLALTISANPSVYQIVTVAIFSTFVLVLNWIVRRPR
jgi:hypothetical protein